MFLPSALFILILSLFVQLGFIDLIIAAAAPPGNQTLEVDEET